MRDFDFFLFSTHFLGDGMALHSTAGEFFRLLTAEQNDEISPSKRTVSLPVAAEDRLPIGLTNTRFGAGIARADYEKEQARQIVSSRAQSALVNVRYSVRSRAGRPHLPARAARSATDARPDRLVSRREVEAHPRRLQKPRRYTRALDFRPRRGRIHEDRSSRTPPPRDAAHAVLGRQHSAVSEACEGFVRLVPPGNRVLQVCTAVLYAAEATPSLTRWRRPHSIILPSFFVKDASVARALFWHRAQSVKCQTTRIVKSPFLPTRTLLMAKQRETSSIRWEREADEQRARSIKSVENGLKELNVKQESDAAIAADHETEDGAPVTVESVAKVTSTSTFVPQTALMGLSMLGSKRRARSF